MEFSKKTEGLDAEKKNLLNNVALLQEKIDFLNKNQNQVNIYSFISFYKILAL